MRARAGLRARWVTLVFATRDVSDGCRVLLLYLADYMTDAGRVSVPREVIADALTVSDRRVTARIKEAIDAGLLSKCGGGFKGQTAQYEALLKVDDRRPPLPVKGGGPASTYGVHLCGPDQDLEVDAWGPPIARASVSETRERHDNERHAGVERASPRTELRGDEGATADAAPVVGLRRAS